MQSIVYLLLLALLVPAILANSCKDNCLSDKCDSCVCGDALSMQDARAICAQYAGWNQDECQCALTHASGANANAVSYRKDGSVDAGLFMINSALWNACSNGKAPCSVAENVQCAINLHKAGSNSFALFESYSACRVEATTKSTSTTKHATTHVSTAHSVSNSGNNNGGNNGNSGNSGNSASNSGSTYGSEFADLNGLKGGKGNTPKDAFAQKFDF